MNMEINRGGEMAMASFLRFFGSKWCLLSRQAAAQVGDFRRETRGATMILAAIMFPVVIGGIGLGTEAGYWLLTQRKLQQTADVSVHAAGVRKRSGDEKPQLEAAALKIALQGGYDPGTMLLNTPPLSGAFAGQNDSVELVLTEVHPRLFSSVFYKGPKPVVIQARAVAGLSGGSQGCVLALSKTAPGAITVTGSTAVDLVGCDVASNSNALNAYLMSGNTAALSTGCVYTVGEAVTTSKLSLTVCDEVQEYASEVRDPYKAVAEPAAVGACRDNKVGSPNKSTTLTPTDNHPSGVPSMRFCGGLDLKGAVTFQPGLYIVDGGDVTANTGDMNSSSVAELIGAGVTFYLTNGARLKLSGNATMTLSAPTTGPFAGLIFFGSRSASSITHQINGNSTSTYHGAIYAPASLIEFRGNSKSTGGCTQVIGGRVTFTGNSGLQTACEDAGTRDLLVNQLVRVVE